jgi:hypothetical protein
MRQTGLTALKEKFKALKWLLLLLLLLFIALVVAAVALVVELYLEM